MKPVLSSLILFAVFNIQTSHALEWELYSINPAEWITGTGVINTVSPWRSDDWRVDVLLPGYLSDDLSTSINHEGLLMIDDLSSDLQVLRSEAAMEEVKFFSEELTQDFNVIGALLSANSRTVAVRRLESEIRPGASSLFDNLYVRLRNADGRFGEPVLIHQMGTNHNSFGMALSADGETLVWNEYRSAGDSRMYVRRNLSDPGSQPECVLYEEDVRLGFHVNADGTRIMALAGALSSHPDISDVWYSLEFDGQSWSEPEIVMLDGAPLRSFVYAVNSDMSSFVSQGFVAERRDGQYVTDYVYNWPESGVWNPSISEDGDIVAFSVLGEYEPWCHDEVYDEQTLHVVYRNPDDDSVSQRIVDRGFLMEHFYLVADGSSLIWTRQAEDPFYNPECVTVEDWMMH